MEFTDRVRVRVRCRLETKLAKGAPRLHHAPLILVHVLPEEYVFICVCVRAHGETERESARDRVSASEWECENFKRYQRHMDGVRGGELSPRDARVIGRSTKAWGMRGCAINSYLTPVTRVICRGENASGDHTNRKQGTQIIERVRASLCDKL